MKKIIMVLGICFLCGQAMAQKLTTRMSPEKVASIKKESKNKPANTVVAPKVNTDSDLIVEPAKTPTEQTATVGRIDEPKAAAKKNTLKSVKAKAIKKS